MIPEVTTWSLGFSKFYSLLCRKHGDGIGFVFRVSDDQIQLLPTDGIEDCSADRPEIGKSQRFREDEQINVTAGSMIVHPGTKEIDLGLGICACDRFQYAIPGL